MFWRIHNPTTRNRQGFDFGSQYRSAIFYHDTGQQAAIASRDAEQQSLRRQIVTQITPRPRSTGPRVPPALPRKAWPPRLRRHHPVNGPKGRPRRGGYQSYARAATAPTVSGRSRSVIPVPPAPGKDRSKASRTR